MGSMCGQTRARSTPDAVKRVMIVPVGGSGRLVVYVTKDAESVTFGFRRWNLGGAEERVTYRPSGEVVLEEDMSVPLWKPDVH